LGRLRAMTGSAPDGGRSAPRRPRAQRNRPPLCAGAARERALRAGGNEGGRVSWKGQRSGGEGKTFGAAQTPIGDITRRRSQSSASAGTPAPPSAATPGRPRRQPSVLPTPRRRRPVAASITPSGLQHRLVSPTSTFMSRTRSSLSQARNVP
jgi:hypothetical protein